MKKGIVVFLLMFLAGAATSHAAASKFYNPENGHNYQVIETAKTWEQAMAYCESLGGYLMTVTNEREHEFVLTQLLKGVRHDIWAGGTDKNKEGDWEWVTGESWRFADWRKGEPNNEFNEDYLELRRSFGFQWNDVPNAAKRNWFVCEWDPAEFSSEKITNEKTGHAYRLIQMRKTWEEAKTYCQEMDGYLATVTSKKEYDFIFNNFLANIDYDIWAGGTDQSSEGMWEWITGEPWKYANWHGGEPNNDGNEDYLEMRLEFGYEWNDVPNSARRNWFVCEWGGNIMETLEKNTETQPTVRTREVVKVPAEIPEPIDLAYETPQKTYTYYLPVFMYTDKFFTGLSLSNNDTSADANVMITIFDTAGKKTYASALAIVPDGQVSEVLYPEKGGSGWILVTSDHSLTGVCFIIAAGTGVDNYMAAIPLSPSKFTNLQVSHVTCDKSWDTILFVANPTSGSQVVSIKVVKPDGTTTLSADKALPPLGCGEYSLSQLLGGMDLMGGKVKLSAPDGVVAFSLYSNLKAGARAFAGVSCMQPFEKTDGDGERLLGK